MRNAILFASDLDNTLLYSYKYKQANDICVEKIGEKEQGFMPPYTYHSLSTISSQVNFVPITSRSLTQYQRIQWSNTPTYTLTTNGAILLKNSKADEAWLSDSQKLIKPYQHEMQQLYASLCIQYKHLQCRMVDDMYLFVYGQNDLDIADCALQYQGQTNLTIYFFGKKLYFFPPEINKGTALQRICSLLSPKMIVSAGDSCLDLPMLEQAHFALVPNVSLAKLLPKEKVMICEANRSFPDFVMSILTDISLFP